MSNVVDFPGIDEIDRVARERYSRQVSGGGDDGMWQQSVENRLTDLSTRLENLGGEVRTNFRWTWAGLAAMFVLLAGLSIQGYLRLDASIHSLNESVSDLVISVSPKGGNSPP